MKEYRITYTEPQVGRCVAYKWAHDEKEALTFAFGKQPKKGEVVNKHNAKITDILVEEITSTNT